MQHVARRHHQFLWVQADVLTTRILRLANLHQHLFQRSLAQSSGGRQNVGHCRGTGSETLSRNVSSVAQRSAVTTQIRCRVRERVVQIVSENRFQSLDDRLSTVLSHRGADANVLAIFHKDLRQCKTDTINLVGVTLVEQLTTLVVGHFRAVRHNRGRLHTVEHRLFVVGTGDTRSFREDFLVLVFALVINAIRDFVEDGFYHRSKVCTTHGYCTRDEAGSGHVSGKYRIQWLQKPNKKLLNHDSFSFSWSSRSALGGLAYVFLTKHSSDTLSSNFWVCPTY